MTQYFLVGAEFDPDGDGDDRTEHFVRCGYWQMGWHFEDQPVMADRVESMRPGDGVAIKRWHGGTDQRRMTIRALGVVKELGRRERVPHSGELKTTRRVYIDWKLIGLDRVVDARGASTAIHRYEATDDNKEWLNEIFRLV